MKIRFGAIRYLPLIAALLVLTGCSSTGMETVKLRIEGVEFTVEVARTFDEQQRGLMYRRSLDEDKGMIFIYEDDRKLAYWMKNTLIPLTIAYISKDGEIVELYDMEPRSLRTVPSQRSVRYALELNLGAFARIGAGIGSIVEFPEDFPR